MIHDAEMDLFRQSLRQVVERHDGGQLDGALVEAGWVEALETDPPAAVGVLFPLLGSANARCAALEKVLAVGAGISVDLEAVVVLPPLGGSSAPASLEGGTLAVRGVAMRKSPRALVTTAGGEVYAVQAVEGSRVGGIDPWSVLIEMDSRDLPFELAGTARWDDGLALARIALGYELAGAARSMLGLAREHALERIQFGGPIAGFQAVRHRLAETLIAVESAEAVLDSARDEPETELAAMAKSMAGRASRIAARHCQQVLAGIGFTAEHPFHRYLRRTMLLDQLLGSTRTLTEELGSRVLEARRLPDLLPL